MLILLGSMTAAGGLFLFLWYRTVVSLPVGRQPRFIHSGTFKWGIPAASLVVFSAGLFLLGAISLWMAAAALGIGSLVFFLWLKFDRYTAEMRLIHDHYRRLRDANPGMEELEVLFLTAQWRHPDWAHDRILELVAGRDIENLMLLMLLSENKIDPLSDWELYRSLKARAARLAAGGK
jgi:hypothetical protein